MLFGDASPQTVIADTACELLILQKRDIDEVLKSFPVVQEQMKIIEDEVDYKNKVLAAIKHKHNVGALR